MPSPFLLFSLKTKYDDKVMGETYLGSIVSESPEVWLKNDGEGDIDDMIDEAIDQHRG